MWDVAAFAAAVQRARKAQGLTQEQVGERLGVTGQAVSKWENGDSAPDLAVLPDLCAVLETSADALLGVVGGQGLEAVARALRQRLDRLPAPERAAALGAVIGRLVDRPRPGAGGAPAGAPEWAGEDFLGVAVARRGRLGAATLLTERGSVVHIAGADDLTLDGERDSMAAAALALFADPVVVGICRRLLCDDGAGRAVREEAGADAAVHAACDRLMEGELLTLTREGYELSAVGALHTAALLLLGGAFGFGGEMRRLRMTSFQRGAVEV